MDRTFECKTKTHGSCNILGCLPSKYNGAQNEIHKGPALKLSSLSTLKLKDKCKQLYIVLIYNRKLERHTSSDLQHTSASGQKECFKDHIMQCWHASKIVKY